MTIEALNEHSIKPNNLEMNKKPVSRFNTRAKEASTTVIQQKWKPCPTRVKRNWP